MADVALPPPAAVGVFAFHSPPSSTEHSHAHSVAMAHSATAGSLGSRSSGGETVAAADDDDDEGKDRERDIADSLSRLEGRTPPTPKLSQPTSPFFPVTGEGVSVGSTGEATPDTVPRRRLLSSSPHHGGRSSRASVATFDSLQTSGGESVYEDARTGETEDDDWEDDEPNLPQTLPHPDLAKSPILPDTPPTEEELESASSDLRKTPKASAPATPPQSFPDFFDGQSAHSAFEEQAILLQRRATLQARASRQAAIRQSISVAPSPSSTVIALRRFSAAPRTAAHPTDPHRSPPSAAALSASPPRQWHPKPLVLTPARTINTPLTSAPLTSPARKRESLSVQSLGHSRSHSNVSTGSNWSNGSRPLSPPNGRSSPFQLGRKTSYAGPPRRCSMGYLESVGDIAQPTVRHRKSMSSTSNGGGRMSWMTSPPPSATLPLRHRTASEDTGGSAATGESSTTRYTYTSSGRSGESPDSSTRGWSGEKDKTQRESVALAGEGGGSGGKNGSPLLDDEEWEMEYYRRTATPLEAVDEVPGSETPALLSESSFPPDSQTAEPNAPSPRTAQEAANIGLSATTAPPLVALSEPTPVSSPALPPPVPYVRPAQPTEPTEPYSPPLPPKEPLSSHTSPRIPHTSPQLAHTSPRLASTARSPLPTTPPSARRISKYDQHWNGEPTFDSSPSASAAEESDASLPSPIRLNHPTTPSRPTSQLNPAYGTDSPSTRSVASSEAADRASSPASTPRKGKPIVIKSVTARSSAANARRSQRLSQVNPPMLGDDSHRLSVRLSKRLSLTPGSPKQQQQPLSTDSKLASPEQRSPPQPRSPQPTQALSAHRSSGVPGSGLAIWPPPAETKTVSLAPPLSYVTDSEEQSSVSFGGNESATDDEDVSGLRERQQRERARIGSGSSSPRSSGYSFPHHGERRSSRRAGFEPRDPRARRDEEDVGDSFLEVLLNTEPPAQVGRRNYLYDDDEDRRWSNYSASTMETYKRGSAGSFATTRTGSTFQSPVKPSTNANGSSGGGFTKKLFGGFGTKSPGRSDDEQRKKKPISIAPGSSRRTKPRPVVSAPLELQAASSAMMQQRSLSSSSLSSQGSSQQYWGSAQSSPSQSQHIALGAPLALKYAQGASVHRPLGDDTEELASMYGDRDPVPSGRPSLDSVYRPPPKAYALPPGLLNVGDAPPPPPSSAYSAAGRPVRPSASPSSATSPSPAQSFTSVLNSPLPFQSRSRQGSKDSSAGGSFVSAQGGNGGFTNGVGAASPLMHRAGSTDHQQPTREVLRAQFLER
ncbi:hypothetical protein JCM8097_006049 [Rhodosporidiobolus ruineniae]